MRARGTIAAEPGSKPSELTTTPRRIMERIKTAFMAGLVATVVVGSMLLMNNALHRLPRLGIGRSLASIIGVPDNVFVGWLVFVVLGIFVFSAVFALTAPRIPVKAYLVKGLLFGTACWLLMMIIFMPLAGQGLFAFDRGLIVAASCLVLNLVYGVIVSLIYRWLVGPESVSSAVKV
jgi:uncharacterized membrane protein YagU involved in acid resistance